MPRLSVRNTSDSRPLRNTLFFFLAVVTLGVVGACDVVSVESTDTGDQSDDPKEVEIRADAFTQADILFEPVSLSSGETFSIELMDDERDQHVTRITHEGTTDGRQVLRARFDPLNPASITVKCRNQNAGTERTMATLDPGRFKSQDGEVEPVATTREKEPTSYHYIENGDDVIVEVDYDQVQGGADALGAEGTFEFSSSDQPVKCTHVSFVLEDVSTALSADGIQFSGGDQRLRFRKKRIR